MEQELLKKRKRQALETKDRIFKAALSLINEKGIDNVQIEEISQRASVSMGLFYKYFSNKADVISEAVTSFCDACYKDIYNVKLKDLEGLERVMKFIWHVADLHLYLHGKPEMRYHYSNLLLSAQRSNWTLNNGRTIYVMFQDAIAQAVKRGELQPDTDILRSSQHLAVIIRGAIFEYLLYEGKEGFDLDNNSWQIVATYLKGLSTEKGLEVLAGLKCGG